MKRAKTTRKSPHSLPVNETSVLQLDKILQTVGLNLLEPFLEGKKKMTGNETFQLKLFSDATLSNESVAESMDATTLFLCPIQFSLLINLNTEVLKTRLDREGTNFSHNQYEVHFECRHLFLRETDIDSALWEICIDYVEYKCEIFFQKYKY